MVRPIKFYKSNADKLSAPKKQTIVEPSRNASIERIPGGLRIMIPGWLGWGSMAFHLIWSYFAVDLSGDELLNILHGKADWGTIGLLLFWNIHLLLAVPLLLWQVAGREVILIDGVSMSQRLEIFGLGWARRFPVADIRALGVSSVLRADAGNEWRTDMLRSCVSFLCGNKNYRLGWGLSYGAAVRVAHAIHEAYPDVSRSM